MTAEEIALGRLRAWRDYELAPDEQPYEDMDALFDALDAQAREIERLRKQAKEIKATTIAFPDPVTNKQNAMLGTIAYRADAMLATPSTPEETSPDA